METMESSVGKIHLATPKGLNYFTSNRAELQIIHDHFTHVLPDVQTECHRVGVSIHHASDWTGIIEIAGEPKQISEITRSLFERELIIGKSDKKTLTPVPTQSSSEFVMPQV